MGTTIDNIPCYHIDEFEQRVDELDISIVIVSSPTSVAANLVLPIINAGIKGVLNFTSAPLNFPQGIVVENYDITTLLEKVAYFVKVGEENGEEYYYEIEDDDEYDFVADAFIERLEDFYEIAQDE